MPARVKQQEAEPLRPPKTDEDLPAYFTARSPDCIKVLDLDGRLLSMNAGGLQTLEICDFQTIAGKEWTHLWEGDDRRACVAALAAARAGGVGHFTGFFTTMQTHQPRWFDVVVSPIPGADGRPEKFLAVSRDVTGLKRSEDLLRAMTEATASVTGEEFFKSLARQAARAMQARYAFVAGCDRRGQLRRRADEGCRGEDARSHRGAAHGADARFRRRHRHLESLRRPRRCGVGTHARV